MPFLLPSKENPASPVPSTPVVSWCAGLERRLGGKVLCVVWAIFFQLLCLSYLPALKGPFLYDDVEAIVANADLRFPLEPWRILGDHEISLHFDRRPVSGLLTLLDFQLWHFNASGYRMTNLVLHFVTAMAIAALASLTARKMGSRFPSLVGHLLALVWLFHPLATSTVSFIFQRSEMLMSLFFVLSLYFLLRSEDSKRSKAWLSWSLVCAFLSGLSKETGLTVVLAIPLFAGIVLRGSPVEAFRSRKTYFLVLAAGALAITLWVRTGVRFTELKQGEMELNHSWGYFKYQCPVIAHYLKLVVFPHPLAFLPRFQEMPTFLGCLPYFLGLTGAGAALLFAGKRRPWLWLCMGGFLVILAPTSSFIPIPLEPEAEFRMYLPLAFVLAGLIGWLGGLSLRSRLSPVWFGGALLLLVSAEVAVSMARNRVYSGSLALWEDTLRKAPLNGKSWINLGFSYLEEKRYDEARGCAHQLIQWGQQQKSRALAAGGEHLYATVELEDGDAYRALEILEKLSAEDPGAPGIRLGYVHALAAAGRPKDALEILRRHYPEPTVSHPAIARLYGGVFRILGLKEEENAIADHLKKSGDRAGIRDLVRKPPEKASAE